VAVLIQLTSNVRMTKFWSWQQENTNI